MSGKLKRKQTKDQRLWRQVSYLHQASFRLAERHPNMARYLQGQSKLLREKHTLRVTPETKRSFCKSCLVPWVPGTSVSCAVIRRLPSQPVNHVPPKADAPPKAEATPKRSSMQRGRCGGAIRAARFMRPPVRRDFAVVMCCKACGFAKRVTFDKS
ncbi:MAG: uncharacterized protein KVP18_003506 [Porospora cf. gigantea A]|uniref:uncharacterized protein n=1 Tax=Porospora cf. gigantea A TaxID=2853593 RepID=UPI003559BFCF|nr:MAG: hypothetical protein KVP18_003506 [Porospora cf. gigantea A]